MHGCRIGVKEGVEWDHVALLGTETDVVGHVLQDFGHENQHTAQRGVLQAWDDSAKAVLQRLDQRGAKVAQKEEAA